MVIMDTFPATVTKDTKISEVAIVNCAYQSLCILWLTLLLWLPTSPNSCVCCVYKTGNLGTKVTLADIGKHIGHRKFGNVGEPGGKGNHRKLMKPSTIGKDLGKADICD